MKGISAKIPGHWKGRDFGGFFHCPERDGFLYQKKHKTGEKACYLCNNN
jgi:hypothetical protein